MHTNIEIILRELYALDPSLKEHDESIRPFIKSLIETHPPAQVDAAFVTELRARLLERAPESTPTIHHDFAWWMVRLVPMGALALLLLILAPERFSTTPTSVPSAAPGMMLEVGTSLMMVEDTGANSLNIAMQKPGRTFLGDYVTLAMPGFLVVHEDSEGEFGAILGVSELLPGGTSEKIPVTLSRDMKDEETLFAALYADNGDGKFNRETDTPVIDSLSGGPMYMIVPVSRFASPDVISG